MTDNYFIYNAAIVTLDDNDTFYDNAYLLIENGKLTYVGGEPPEQKPDGCTTINASGLLLCPGLVNAHTHTPMTILRGFKDDVPLEQWLDKIWKAEEILDAEDYFYSSQLGLAEMLSYGTTSVTDMYRNSSVLIDSAISSGIKANICESLTSTAESCSKDMEIFNNSAWLIDTYNGYDHDRIRCDTSIQSIFQTTPDLWVAVRQLAVEKDITIHMHICETKSELDYALKQYGKTPIACFAEAGVFDAQVCAAHGIYVAPEETEILSAAGSSVIHDPVSNLKCCCGFANLKPFTEKHINIGLGTDGVCSNNSGDLFETMKFTALNQKMLNDQPDFLPAGEVLRMAVHGGLRSQKRNRQAGVLAPGYDADLIAIDLHHPGMLPLTSTASNLVYSANGGHVVFTMVRGKMLYNRGEFMTIDMERTIYQNNKSLKKLNRI